MKALIFCSIICSVLIACSSSSPDSEPGASVLLVESGTDASNVDTTQTPATEAPATEVPAIEVPAMEAPVTQVSNDPAEPITTGQDPLIQNMVEVTFDITVPAYKSNELRIEVLWGEVTALPASWVGDEYWTATATLPTGKRDDLTVTFYDENGRMELAVVEQELTTGTNAAETVKIEADQFDRERFDTDGDGTNNLDELIGGNDPRVDESALLNVIDSVDITYLISSSQLLELELPDERPYNFSDSTFVKLPNEETLGTSYSTEINIDADGNGTYSYSSYSVFFRESRSGTRTNSGNSISWEGRFTTYDGDYGRGTDVTSTVSMIDDDTYEIVEDLSEVYSGTYRDTWDVSSHLTGKRIEGTSLCEAVAGTVSFTRWTNRGRNYSSPDVVTTNVSKAVEDQYWKVEYINADNESSEYLARELVMVSGRFLSSDRVSEDGPPTFKCDFVDFNG